MVKPVPALSRIQVGPLMTSPVSSAMMAPEAAKAPKARTWPTRRTSRGAKQAPADEAARPGGAEQP